MTDFDSTKTKLELAWDHATVEERCKFLKLLDCRYGLGNLNKSFRTFGLANEGDDNKIFTRNGSQ
jgi:hypothetical protein